MKAKSFLIELRFLYGMGEGERGTDNLDEPRTVVCCVTFLCFVDLAVEAAFFTCSSDFADLFVASH